MRMPIPSNTRPSKARSSRRHRVLDERTLEAGRPIRFGSKGEPHLGGSAQRRRVFGPLRSVLRQVHRAVHQVLLDREASALLLIANGHDTKRAKPGARVDRAKLRQIDLHWHDLRHEGACRLLAEHVDIRTIQLMLGHADIKQTQRYLNMTDEEVRKAMTGVWERRRQLRAVS
jgi:integrase